MVMFDSFLSGVFLGFGAFSVDMLYLCLLQFGLLNFLNNVIFMRSLAIFSFCFLTYMAYLMLRKKESLSVEHKEFEESLFKSYIKGAFLNGSNPFVIGFWLSIASVVLSSDHAYLMTLGLIMAILSWVGALAFVVARYSHVFSAKVVFIINIVSVIVIECFALNLLYKTFLG